MKNVICRELTENDDVELIYDFFLNPVLHFLSKPLEKYPLKKSYYEGLVRDKDCIVLGLWEAERLFGSLFLHQYLEKKLLNGFYVKPSFRREGAAKLLLDTAKNFVGIGEKVQCFVHENIRELQFLMEKSQFQKTGKNITAVFEEQTYVFWEYNYIGR